MLTAHHASARETFAGTSVAQPKVLLLRAVRIDDLTIDSMRALRRVALYDWSARVVAVLGFAVLCPSAFVAEASSHSLPVADALTGGAPTVALIPAASLTQSAYLPAAPVMPHVLYKRVGRGDIRQVDASRGPSLPSRLSTGLAVRLSSRMEFRLSEAPKHRIPLYCLNCVLCC